MGCERSCYADDVTLLMGVGVGWDVKVHVTLMIYGACGVWGGVGWDVNVHVTLMMLRCSWGWGGVGW